MKTVTKPVLCLDFDGVLHRFSTGWRGARVIPDVPVEGALEFLLQALEGGWDVVIHSSRARYWGGISAMRRWLKKHAGALWYDSPGTPGIERVRFMRWKPPAAVTIDDRAITFNGNWPDLDLLREFRPWYYKRPFCAGPFYLLRTGRDGPSA